MTVIQVVTHFDMGGAERIAINIAKSNSGIEYHMIEVSRGSSSFSEDFIKEMEQSGIIYHRSPIQTNKKALFIFPFRLRKLILAIHPEVVQTHTENPDLGVFLTYYLFPGLFKNVQIVRTLHNTVLWQGWKPIGKIVERFYLKNKANVTNSKRIAEAYQKEFGIDTSMKLIYNGFAPVKQEKYQSIVEGKRNILFAGRFHSQKGIPVLIETIKRVNPNIYHFHVAGKGELEKDLRDGLKGMDNVTITGPIFNLSKYLGTFDYVFIPSVHEGLNSLSIECAFNHTAVIINNCDGLNETVPEEYPLKVDNNSVDGFVELFKYLEAKNPSEFSSITNAYASKMFSMKTMQEQYEKLYLTNEKV